MTLSTFLWCVWDEAARHLRSPTLQLAAVVLAALCAVSVAAGSLDFNARVATYAGHAGASGELFGAVYRPPQIGSVVVRGSDPFTPDAWEVVDDEIRELSGGPARGRDSEVGPPFDVEILIRWFAGLFAVLLGAQSVLGALTSGLCRTFAAMPTGFRAMTIARGTGVMLAMAYVLTLMLLATRAAVGLATESTLHTSANVAIWWLAVPGLLYLLLMVSIGMAIAAVVRVPLRTVMFAALAWLLLSVVGPQVVVSASRVWPESDNTAVWFSPGTHFLAASADLMGTGPGSRQAWRTAVEEHYAAVRALRVEMTPPVFRPPAVTSTARWNNAESSLLMLAGFVVVALLAAGAACGRLRTLHSPTGLGVFDRPASSVPRKASSRL